MHDALAQDGGPRRTTDPAGGAGRADGPGRAPGRPRCRAGGRDGHPDGLLLPAQQRRQRQRAPGYTNSSAATQTIPRGAGNVITPSRYDGAQPTVFAPGNHPGAFALTVGSADVYSANWTLDGSSLSSSTAVSQCPAGTSLPADGNGLGMTMVLLAAGAVAAVALVVSRLRGRRALRA